jgi:cell division transport system permease protein
MTDNPLPASLGHGDLEGQRDPEALRRLSDVLARVPAVEDVEWGEESVTRLSAMARGLRLVGLVAFLIVLLTTITVVAATLQLAIYARREEIEIQKLVGATDRFVRVPFILEGLMQGLLGGLLALGALMLFARFAVPQLKSVLGFLLAQEFPVRMITPRLGVELLVGGAALGLMGSMLAVRRFLRV